MKQEREQERYKVVVSQNLPKKIDSEFVRYYFGKMNQLRLGLGDLNEFEDAMIMNGLAGIDCRGIDFRELSQGEFESIPFDTFSIFSKETIEQFNPENILERGKSFGQGLDQIPLTGKGIHIAIRDQNCNPYLTDANIVDYTRVKNGKVYKQVSDYDIEHMHGKATTSLLASKSCGVAKDADVHFFSGSIDDYVKYIVDYNKKCKEENKEEDMILIASGSWRDKNFINHSEILRDNGCELICANNFDKNFNEFTSNGEDVQVPLKVSEKELEMLIKEYPDRAEMIKYQAERKDMVKIPISRTYHQVGESNGFKYQSAYSTSWGIPQVAGLFAVFKQADRTLTFDQFCEIANRTAKGKERIINPPEIYKELERNLQKQDGKNGFDDCMKSKGLSVSNMRQAWRYTKTTLQHGETKKDNQQSL